MTSSNLSCPTALIVKETADRKPSEIALRMGRAHYIQTPITNTKIADPTAMFLKMYGRRARIKAALCR